MAAKLRSKRDSIVALFLESERATSADQLFDAIRARDPRVGRATVYRTLQWMVETGLARKVDVGDGRSHFEHGVPRPKQLHLVCDACHRAWDVPGGHIESLIARAASEKGFEVARTILEVHGTCEACRASAADPAVDPIADALVLRDVLRMAINDAHGELTFYATSAGEARDPRLRATLARMGEEIRERVATLEAGLREQLARNPLLESRPTQLFVEARATAPFGATTGELDRIDTDRDLLTLAIRCERAAHRAFKRLHKRVSSAAAQRVLLDSADQQRARLDHLLRDYRAIARDAARAARRLPGPVRPRRTQRAVP